MFYINISSFRLFKISLFCRNNPDLGKIEEITLPSGTYTKKRWYIY